MAVSNPGLPRYIDVWDIDTFDRDLLIALAACRSALVDHLLIATEDDLAADPTHKNDEAARVTIAELLARRSVRGWHYTRLADDELERFDADGIQPASLEGLNRRLSYRVEAGDLSREQADVYRDTSPLHRDFMNVRAVFCAVSHPHPTTFSDLQGQLNYWGGEVAHFYHQETPLGDALKGIGRRRVLEIVAPIGATNRLESVRRL
jgi:hypothetical protein